MSGFSICDKRGNGKHETSENKVENIFIFLFIFIYLKIILYNYFVSEKPSHL